MPRKKTVKRTVKRQATSNNLFASIQKLEEDFLSTPAKLGAHLNKNISTLKQKENKLKSAINKNKTQAKQSQNRIKIAAKSKNAKGKKQLAKIKRAHSLILKDQTALAKQLADVSKLIQAGLTKQSKVASLKKYLGQFEKEWAKQAKKLKAKATQKPKKKATARKKSVEPAQEQTQIPQSDLYRITEDSTIDEKTEVTS